MFDPINSHNDSNGNVLGQALLAIGGIVLAGVIISNWSDDESARETRSSTDQEPKPKKYQRKNTVSSQYYKVKVIDPIVRPVSRSEQTLTQERKYPSNYYDLTKAQQYKYRRQMAKDLYELSKEKN